MIIADKWVISCLGNPIDEADKEHELHLYRLTSKYWSWCAYMHLHCLPLYWRSPSTISAVNSRHLTSCVSPRRTCADWNVCTPSPAQWRQVSSLWACCRRSGPAVYHLSTYTCSTATTRQRLRWQITAIVIVGEEFVYLLKPRVIYTVSQKNKALQYCP